MRAIAILVMLLWTGLATAQSVEPRDGWGVYPTTKSFDALVDAVKSAAKANKMGVVTQAGPTGAAANRGITIPGNRVIGLFNNIYAVRILNLSVPAMIEAPIRVYVTENPDGTATLSYKTPSLVFAPYMDGADPDLGVAATELDEIFATIAQAAAS